MISNPPGRLAGDGCQYAQVNNWLLQVSPIRPYQGVWG